MHVVGMAAVLLALQEVVVASLCTMREAVVVVVVDMSLLVVTDVHLVHTVTWLRVRMLLVVVLRVRIMVIIISVFTTTVTQSVCVRDVVVMVDMVQLAIYAVVEAVR